MQSYNKALDFTSSYFYLKEIVDVYCVINKLKLSEQVKNTLIFFIIYGISKDTYSKIIENKIAPSLSIVNVYKTKLANEKLVFKIKKSQWAVCKDLLIKSSSFSFNLNYKKLGKT